MQDCVPALPAFPGWPFRHPCIGKQLFIWDCSHTQIPRMHSFAICVFRADRMHFLVIWTSMFWLFTHTSPKPNLLCHSVWFRVPSMYWGAHILFPRFSEPHAQLGAGTEVRARNGCTQNTVPAPGNGYSGYACRSASLYTVSNCKGELDRAGPMSFG